MRVFESLVGSWADRPLGYDNGWASEISDDNTPVEFSLAIARDRTDVRVLFEPQGSEPNLAAYRTAALELHERLEQEFEVDLSRFRRVVDLFAPEGMSGPFAIWNSVVFSGTKKPAFKTYFNPQARGAGRAQALVEEALNRLGFHGSWGSIAQSSVRRGPHLDEIKYFALDLSRAPLSRVKVYARHHHATPEDLELACSAQDNYVEGEALEFARSMGGTASLSNRATFTCSAFVEGRDRPYSATLYIPICAYAHSDAAAKDAVVQYLDTRDIASSFYSSTLSDYAERPLETSVGLQSWIAIKRTDDQPIITVYLATEANRVFEPGMIPAATPSRLMPPEDPSFEYLSCYPLVHHPTSQRMRRQLSVDSASPAERVAYGSLIRTLATWLGSDEGLANADHLQRIGVSTPALDEMVRNLEVQLEALSSAADRHEFAAAFGAADRCLAELESLFSPEIEPHPSVAGAFQAEETQSAWAGVVRAHQAIWCALDTVYRTVGETRNQARSLLAG